jgi:DNA-binding NtrC family response regulator/tetratricopeptide (TPR) repeat protein
MMQPAELLGRSAAIQAVRAKMTRLLALQRSAPRLPLVLIEGETGTGKGLLARMLHRAGSRAEGRFVDVNCAAIPENLLEAEMFGFEQGAFTDARRAKPGLLQMANRGTMFLDEVSLLPQAMQAKLLKVLDDRTVRRLGGIHEEPLDVWIVAATNGDLRIAVREQRFREDLYHRLAIITLRLPPLRDRGDDIILLAEHFVARACVDYGLPPRVLTDEARARLAGYSWPGNIRELANVLDRAVLLSESAEIGGPALDFGAATEASGPSALGAPPVMASRSLQHAMREQVQAALDLSGGNISRTAATLGIARNTLRARMREFGLRPGAETAVAPSPARRDRAIRWEQRLVTLMRMSLVTREEPAGTYANRVFDLVIDKVRGFGGRIEGLSRSELLTVFDHEGSDEPTVRAAYCAIALQRALEQSGLGAEGEVALRVGLHVSGMLVEVGGGQPMLDAVAGREAWSVTETLLRDAAPGMIVATPEAAAFLRRRLSVAPTAAGSASYLVEGPRRIGVGSAGEQLNFVGRGEELALLTSRFKQASQGRGQVVCIVGEVGIGKSRLLVEVVKGLPAGSVRYLEGHCLSVGPTMPFAPLIAIIKDACGIRESDTAATTDGRLAAALEESGVQADQVAADLRRLVGPAADPTSVPPDLMKRRLFDAIHALLVAQSRKTPVVVIVEDLHWVDEISEACLDLIVNGLGTASILALFTYRTGYRPPWLGKSNVSELSLSPLLPDEGFALVQSMGASDDVARQIVARGEGNPLFLEELSRAALQHGGTLPDQAPATIEETIAARLGRLEARPREVLNLAAVIGRDVSLRLLRQASDLSDHVLDTELEELQRADFLHEAYRPGAEAVYMFKHALLQEVTYRRVAQAARRSLHRQILDAAEHVYADRFEDHVEALAHHAVHGDVPDRAVRYLLQAGRKAAARAAMADAVKHFRIGLHLLQGLPESADRHRQELELQVSLGVAEATRQGFAAPDVGRIHQRARELCGHVEAGPLLLGALGGLWQFYYYSGNFAASHDLAEQHRSAVLRTGEMNRLCGSYDALGYVSFRVGQLPTACEQLAKAMELYDTYPRPEGTSLTPLDLGVAAEGGLAMVLSVLGRAGDARHHARNAIDRAIRLVQRSGALSLAYAHACASRVHFLMREPALAASHAASTVEVSQKHGYALWIIIGQLELALARISGGDPEAGLALLIPALSKALALGLQLDRPCHLAGLAEVHRQRGDAATALATIEEALAHIDRHGERLWEAEVYRLRGEVRLEVSPDRRDAAADFERAIAIAREQGARLFELRATLRLHRLRTEEGRPAETGRALRAMVDALQGRTDTLDLEEARTLLDALWPA